MLDVAQDFAGTDRRFVDGNRHVDGGIHQIVGKVVALRRRRRGGDRVAVDAERGLHVKHQDLRKGRDGFRRLAAAEPVGAAQKLIHPRGDEAVAGNVPVRREPDHVMHSTRCGGRAPRRQRPGRSRKGQANAPAACWPAASCSCRCA